MTSSVHYKFYSFQAKGSKDDFLGSVPPPLRDEVLLKATYRKWQKLVDSTTKLFHLSFFKNQQVKEATTMQENTIIYTYMYSRTRH